MFRQSRIAGRYFVRHARNGRVAPTIAGVPYIPRLLEVTMTFLKRFLSILVVSGCVLAAWAAGAADEPDGLRLPAGFHARVVAEALGPIRHLAVRSNGDIYVSTLKDAQGKGGGIIALHLDTGYKADQVEHFGTADGTGIRF